MFGSLLELPSSFVIGKGGAAIEKIEQNVELFTFLKAILRSASIK